MNRIALTLKMKKIATLAQQYFGKAVRVLARFLTNSPANDIEAAVFNKLRTLLTQVATAR